jgi:hypothetical protein
VISLRANTFVAAQGFLVFVRVFLQISRRFEA